MAYELIPFPISILFILVFAVVWIVVLWKLRRKAKIYSILFKISLFATLALLLIFVYSILTKSTFNLNMIEQTLNVLTNWYLSRSCSRSQELLQNLILNLIIPYCELERYLWISRIKSCALKELSNFCFDAKALKEILSD